MSEARDESVRDERASERGGARVLVAGGHSAGHIEPALNLADALRRLDPTVEITALGTERGLDTTLIPARGYPLELIPPVPLPRKPGRALLATPGRLNAAVRAAAEVMQRLDIDVVVGFGGYVAMPAYLAARRRDIPIVLHEANARPGVANRIGARLTNHVFTASAAVRLPHATAIGIPLRPDIADLDRGEVRTDARLDFGLLPDTPTLLVTGGSQGARAINTAMEAAADSVRAAGVQVLHIVGPSNTIDISEGKPPYVVVPYVERMRFAYAAADFVLCRSGAMTCAELTAVGLPAAYVPLPLRGGEQRFNAVPIVEAGGGLLVDNVDVSPHWILREIVPLITDPERLTVMSHAAGQVGARDAGTVLAQHVLTVAAERRRFGTGHRRSPDERALERHSRRPRPVIESEAGDKRAREDHEQMSTSTPTHDAATDRPDDWEAPGAALVRSAATDAVPALADLGRLHIMGIAGAGMSGLARILVARGVPVSGCEARDSNTVAALRAVGATVHIGHSATHLDDADTFVYTTAINPKHPEFVAARDSGMPVLRRAAALAAALEDKQCVAITGTHGKTTTTSLLTVGVQACGLDPSFAIGGNFYETGLNAHLGTGELAIVEGDESDGSFLLLRPSTAVITNVEADHLENHGDLEGIFRAFEQFVDRIDHNGVLFVCADDPGARRIADYARGSGRRVRTYGESEHAEIRVSAILEDPDGVEFTAHGAGMDGLRVRVGALVGRHMALNASAALGVAAELGLDLDIVLDTWREFRGVHRRFEYRGTSGGISVYDDYAHHPTEVAAELSAARSVVGGGGRLIAVFQPGTYSRTQTFAKEFATAMGIADIAVVMDIFPAREEPIPGVTGALIADQIPLPPENVIYEPSFSATPQRIAEVAAPGDVIVTMGIGNVYLLCPEILTEIAGTARDG
jgi:UDP-N-acetylmuramate--alanine ligase